VRHGPHIGTYVPVLAMKHQFWCNIPLPQFGASEHANENSACRKFLMVENHSCIHGRVFSCMVAVLRVYVGITRQMNENWRKQVSKKIFQLCASRTR
jgi:hypothetical protein